MTCTRYEYQLSLHLDGRLSSARRDAVMGHLADCDSCQALWREMQGAQDLALSLPEYSPSRGFKETLMARIRSGEGTPEAVFKEPVPILVKLRYLSTGAAAAAVLLLGLNWYGNLRGENLQGSHLKIHDPQGDGVQLASIDPDSLPPLQTNYDPLDANSFGIHPFIPTYVAEAGASSITDTVADLQYRTADLASRVERMPPRQLLREDRTLAGLMRRLRGSVGLMRWMQDGNIISLPTRFDSELRLTESSLNQLQSAESPDEFRFALDRIKQLQIERMRDKFQVICCQNPQDFFDRFSSVVSRIPDISRVLQVQVLQSHDPKRLTDPRGSRRVMIRFQIRPSTVETELGGK